MNYAKTISMLQNPDGLEKAFIFYLAENGIVIQKSKSFGGIVSYDQRTVVGQKITDFFTGTFSANNTNLPNNYTRLEGEYMVVTDARLYTGVNATVEATDWTPGVSSGELQNGTLSIKNNGINVLPKIPITQFTQAVENPFSGYYDLPFYTIWGGQETFVTTLSFPVAPAVANQNMRVEMIGLGLVS